MANDLPTPQSYEQILSDMLSAYAAKLGINDFNVGAANISFFEVAALSTARASGDLFQILRDFSIDRATGDALKRLATENRVTPISAKPATGLVTVLDESFTKISTKVYAGSNPPNIGSTQIKVSDASSFDPTGAIYIGRGTPNVEGPLPYSSIAPSGGFYLINLSSATTKFHNVGETVILAQGGNRAIASNTVVLSPAVGATPDVQYTVTTSAVILDGEVQVENVQVSASSPGTLGNVPRGAIKEFSAPPFSGAAVFNPLPFTTGKDSETDDELRVRIKRALASTGLGTATAIKASVIGATPSDENSSIVSSSIVSSADGATLFIDDGNGYEAKTSGVGLESIIDSALGGEQFFQLATGGRQSPVAKAFLESTTPSPFDLVEGDTLSVTVGETTYQHTFSDSDFRSPGGATAFEVTASINANTALGFEATTSGGGTLVVLRAKSEGNDSLKTSVPTTDGRDASVLLGLPSNQIETLRLYKNKNPLSKDGNTATVFSQSQQLWSSTISNGDTLIIATDGTAPITYTVTDANFIATGLYTAVAATNTLDSWAQVFNDKLTGLTVSVVGQQLNITSNLGANNKAAITIDPTSTLVTKGMFSSIIGLTSQGKASDYFLSRNTAQFELAVPLVAGDQLSAGSDRTEARIQSTQIPGGAVSFSSDAHVWLLIDKPGSVVSTGVVGNTILNITKPSTNIVRYESLITSAFVNVNVGDYLIVWSQEVSAGNRLEGRVYAKTSTTLDILVTPTEYAAAVAEAGVLYAEGFVVVASIAAPQKFEIGLGTKTLDQIAQEFESQTPSALFTILDEQFLVIRSRTKDTSGFILVVTADSQGKLLNLPAGTSDTSKDSLIAFYDSSFTEGQIPGFIHALFATGTAADPIDSYISSFVSSISLAGRDPNDLIAILQPFGDIRDAQPYNEIVQVETIAGTTIGVTDNPLVRRLRDNDRFYLANPLDFGNRDTAVVVLDNDASAKSFEIPFFRRALTNTDVVTNPYNFNAYDVESGSTTNFSSAFGASFDFSNFKVLMQAKKVLKPSPTKTAILYRAAKWGRSGEKVTVGYIYPSAPSSAIGNIVTVGTTVDIKINLQSDTAISTSIASTTEWNVTVTPNTPSAGADQVTFTWNGVGADPALSLSGGEYVNIRTVSGFSAGNTGIYRVSTESGYAPTPTSFTIVAPTGQGVVESNIPTTVTSGITFYNVLDTAAKDVVDYVNANLADYVSATLVNDGDSTGDGIIVYSTYEDSDFQYTYQQLQDGINWIASSNLGSSPQFVFKNALALPSDVGYSFNDGEEVRLVPTTMNQVSRFLSVLAVTGFTTVGTISLVDRATKLEFATDTLGSSGSIQIIGGLANSYEVPVLDSAIRFDNTYMTASVDKVAGQGVHSDQWFRLEALNTQKKATSFSSNSSVNILTDTPAVGKSTIQMLGRDLNQRYFGKPRHHVRSRGRNFRVEKQGGLVCLTWDGVGSNPFFQKASVNFNDTSGGTVNVYPVAGTSDTEFLILTGNANFTELSIGDLVTVSNMAESANNGTFLVTGVSEDGLALRVLNPKGEDQFNQGSFTFTGNSTAGDIFTVGTTNFVAGSDFAVGVDEDATAANLAAALASLIDTTVGVASSTVTLTSTAVVPSLKIDYLGSPVVNTSATFTLNTNSSAGDKFTVSGNDLIAGTDFLIGIDENATATNLAASISLLSGYTAIAAMNVITVTFTSPALTLTFTGTSSVTVQAFFDLTANSTAGDEFTVDATILIAGVDFPVAGTATLTAANLSAIINTLPGVTSVASGLVVTLTATSPAASIAISYSGSAVVTTSGSYLTGPAFVAGDFSASTEVSEGDSVMIADPFTVLNQGTFRVIRRYGNSIWFENQNVIEEEVTLPYNSISLAFNATTSFKVNATDNKAYLNWTGVGTEPALENAHMGDIITFGIDFASANRGDYMVLRSGKKLQQITSITVPTGAQIPLNGSGKYFYIFSAGDLQTYYIWFNVNGTNTDPVPGIGTGVPVAILNGDSATQVATKLKVVLDALTGLDATSSGSTVTVTTTGYQETSLATNFNVPVPFTISTTQPGRRTFLECINPSAVNESAVTVTSGILQCHRPQLNFSNYDATIIGDKFVITGDILGATNAGTYTITDVLSRESVVVTGTLASATNVSLNGRESAVYVEEDVPYTGYKQVYLSTAQPGAPQRNTLLFTTNNQYEKINEFSAVSMLSLNKADFITSIRKGLDSYRFNTGLIAEANRIIYGDPRDPSTYPGVGAAGAEIFVREPLTRRVQVSIDVRINNGVPFAQTVEQVRTSVSSLINANEIGSPIAISAIVSAVNAIPGVKAVAISSPQYDSNHDIIFIAPSEKARIIDPVLDISVSQIGS